MRSAIRSRTIKQLPEEVHHDPHFQPRYNPWDQRLCVCPDGDFFKSLHTGRAEIKTGAIEQVSTTGIILQLQDASGETLEADAIVLATGLKLRVAGGIEILIDGEKCEPSSRLMWNNVMLQDVPNAAFPIGYMNASWTLGADTAAMHFYRLVQHLDRHGIRAAVPRESDESRIRPLPLFNLNATYVTESDAGLPHAAREKPWQPRSTYFADLRKARFIAPAKGLQLIK
ncbi:hypothetical protein AARAC_002019 [Aspergillus arachidicola]|uniref:Monooxygenase n=1 Tax=Aspergillus arachidicola TaxID=656916 RepID=A0A2G7FVJ7_9EURO|nr:hypothetical protein AARAC_002019 [Aspergillus arachidicola]